MGRTFGYRILSYKAIELRGVKGMRKGLAVIGGVVGLMVVFVVSFYVAGRLRAVLGSVVAAEMLAIGFLAAWCATPESKAMATKVLASLRALGWSLKEAALRIRMTEPQLSRQLNGYEQMSLSRYAEWGPEWEHQMAFQMLPKHGLWIENQELAEILRPLTQQSERKEGVA
jgi:hypothetical protein